MQMNQQQLIKSIVDSVGVLIDKRAITLETNLRGEIRGSEVGLKKEIKDSEERTKKELKEEIRELRTGVAKRIIEQDQKIEALEETLRP